MREDELWEYFRNSEISYAKPFDRDFLWVTKETFEAVKINFITEPNILHSGKSFRSTGYMHHIHAVTQGEHMFVHQDIGNVAKFFPLGIIHLFFDVIPYIAFAVWRRVPIASIFVRPK